MIESIVDIIPWVLAAAGLTWSFIERRWSREIMRALAQSERRRGVLSKTVRNAIERKKVTWTDPQDLRRFLRENPGASVRDYDGGRHRSKAPVGD